VTCFFGVPFVLCGFTGSRNHPCLPTITMPYVPAPFPVPMPVRASLSEEAYVAALADWTQRRTTWDRDEQLIVERHAAAFGAAESSTASPSAPAEEPTAPTTPAVVTGGPPVVVGVIETPGEEDVSMRDPIRKS
jgi:hypothetical protein